MCSVHIDVKLYVYFNKLEIRLLLSKLWYIMILTYITVFTCGNNQIQLLHKYCPQDTKLTLVI